jgi:hypothetical protein
MRCHARSAALFLLFAAASMPVGHTLAAPVCSWSVDQPAAATGDVSLEDVTAWSASSALAVGARYDYETGNVSGHVQRWNGVSWTEEALPFVSTRNQLLDVARIPGTEEAWAVGFTYETSQIVRPLILRRAAGGWDALSTPVVEGGLAAVVSTSATDAWAVGWLENGNALALHWDGGEWSKALQGVAGTLKGVAASAPDDVWAVGRFRKNGLFKTLALRWDGTGWTEAPTPNTAGQYNLLEDVQRIPGTSRYWAVGTRYVPRTNSTDEGPHRTITLRWNGTEWRTVTSPSYGPDGSDLNSVTAFGGAHAWAFGRRTTSGPYRPLLLQWNGTSWARVIEPNVPGGWLFGSTRVPGPDRIWTVGMRPGAEYDEQPLIMRGCA